MAVRPAILLRGPAPGLPKKYPRNGGNGTREAGSRRFFDRSHLLRRPRPKNGWSWSRSVRNDASIAGSFLVTRGDSVCFRVAKLGGLLTTWPKSCSLASGEYGRGDAQDIRMGGRGAAGSGWLPDTGFTTCRPSRTRARSGTGQAGRERSVSVGSAGPPGNEVDVLRRDAAPW